MMFRKLLVLPVAAIAFVWVAPSQATIPDRVQWNGNLPSLKINRVVPLPHIKENRKVARPVAD